MANCNELNEHRLANFNCSDRKFRIKIRIEIFNLRIILARAGLKILRTLFPFEIMFRA